MQDMIAIYLLCLLAGVAAFLLLGSLKRSQRLIISILMALVPMIVATVWVANLRDDPPPNARTITPSAGGQDAPR